MALESEYFPQPSPTSTEDRRAYRRILYGIFAFYSVTGMSLAGAAIAGTSFQKAAHIVAATWN
jgi:hypothetical protein